ncbi:hypothetical protein GWI33_001079 [Rhynchophorus ferrugineus]|uniref:Uncharacterized protein n=1 Tax=Rhynchophorus ferrugineus TaxID=354439 RepID=A0A834ISX6_RHYFE|nr:hypothetical protein GWI33_001079 [Rhynchophorus ferrugineus]
MDSMEFDTHCGRIKCMTQPSTSRQCACRAAKMSLLAQLSRLLSTSREETGNFISRDIGDMPNRLPGLFISIDSTSEHTSNLHQEEIYSDIERIDE